MKILQVKAIRHCQRSQLRCHVVTADGSNCSQVRLSRTLAGQLTLTDGSTQNIEVYSISSGQILSESDPSGNTLTYSYDGTLLASITEANGDGIFYDYSGTNLRDIREVTGTGDDAVTVSEIRYPVWSCSRVTRVAWRCCRRGVGLTPG